MSNDNLLSLAYSKNLSLLEKNKIDAASIVPSSINRLSNSTTSIQSSFSGMLSLTRLSQSNTRDLIANSIEPAINNKTTIDRILPGVEISDADGLILYQDKNRPSKVIKRSRESIVGEDDLSYGGLHFPADITEIASAHFRLSIYKYERFSAYNSNDSFNDTPINIYLPVPENVTSGVNVNYAQKDIGFYGDAMNSDLAQTVISNRKSGRDFLDGVNSEDASSLIALVGKRAAYSTLESANEVVGGLAGRIAGEIPNPMPTVFFKGLELRTFTFSWKLVPRNQGESETIREIIKTIKKNSLPGNQDNFLSYPSVFEPAIINRVSSGSDFESTTTFTKYKKCVVRSMMVNYTPEGTSAFFYDGNPCSVILNIDVQEVENYTQEDVDNE